MIIKHKTLSGWVVVFVSLLSVPIGQATASEADPPIKTLLEVGPNSLGVEKAQQAADALVALGPKALPSILSAIPKNDVVKANWLRSAFDRIVDDAARDNKPLPVEELLTFAKHRKHVGLARRLALEAVDNVKPGTAARLIDGWLDDPEFGPDAVAVWMDKAAAIEKRDKAAAVKLYQEAFVCVRDFNQCLALAQRLKALDVSVDALARLGVVRAWMVLGPFDDPEEKGFATPFPPEQEIDLSASYDGKEGKIAWKRFTSSAPDGRVDLAKAVAPTQGAVAYALAVLSSPKAQEVEVRAGGDDNLAVWLNGERVIHHPTYRSHLRIDWHRAKVKLKAGENTLLVKVCQAPAPKEKSPGPPNKWEFHLRIVDEEGRGVPLPVVTPAK